MPVIEIKNNDMAEFISLISSGVTVVDFSAQWCGPCHFIKPLYEMLSENYKNFKFLKVDVDENPDVSAECGIEAMPSFFVYQDGTKIDELIGADEVALQELIGKYA